MYCDNMVTVQAINSGSSRNERVQKCLREIHKLQAWSSFEIKMIYLTSQENRISDDLSRWDVHRKYR